MIFALKRANVEPDECLFVGDNYYDDIVGSSKVNMKSLLINPYGKVGIEELNYAYIISNISELPKFIERNYNLKLF
ncbi:HAD hydrolase-like protein [Clostridium sp. DMHC 10]|uniref:HAD family hydrolase n=1 Tax=Clostridium sp. DMHC 10 TaxID=747377 RepID=UPI00069D04F9|nr:HAD hydrolase-like protein [Clostridium sp. DMHC 10]